MVHILCFPVVLQLHECCGYVGLFVLQMAKCKGAVVYVTAGLLQSSLVKYCSILIYMDCLIPAILLG